MPAIAAHYAYALKVSQKLSPKIRKIINENRSFFTLGAQGPDLLFYHKPHVKNDISTLGHTIHSKPMSEFLKNAINFVENDKNLAYVLGFACHYGLDRACHPFVNNFADHSSQLHCSLEADFDSLIIMEFDLKTKRSKYVPSIYEVAPISEVYGLPEKVIADCTSGFRNFSKYLDNRKLVEIAEFLGDKQGKFVNLCLKKEPTFIREALVMHELFLNSLDSTAKLVEEIYSSARENGDFPTNLQLNFEGV